MAPYAKLTPVLPFRQYSVAFPATILPFDARCPLAASNERLEGTLCIWSFLKTIAEAPNIGNVRSTSASHVRRRGLERAAVSGRSDSPPASRLKTAGRRPKLAPLRDDVEGYDAVDGLRSRDDIQSSRCDAMTTRANCAVDDIEGVVSMGAVGEPRG
ncbi:hypothetical protein K523DRAFT_74529 [Schizophyllum commune Tattone D]|nr:hypothetical protein K523DRAFT_74529 [Schizophyllum commune Tattone D]